MCYHTSFDSEAPRILPRRWTHLWVPAFDPVGCHVGLCITLKQHLQCIIVSVATMMNKRSQFLIKKIGSQKACLMNLYTLILRQKEHVYAYLFLIMRV